MPVSIMAKNYSQRPLKKRPVIFIESDEPQNLSTKPEDLSISNRSCSESPITISPIGSPSSESLSPVRLPVIMSPVRSTSSVTMSPVRTPSPISPSPIDFNEKPALYLPTPHSEYAPQTWYSNISSTYHPAYGYVPSYPYYEVPAVPQEYYMSQYTKPTERMSIDQHSVGSNSSNTSSPPPVMESRNFGTKHECLDCGKTYSTQSGLSKHRQFHCGAVEGTKKIFSCEYCQKEYTSMGALKMHIKTHTLPCKCDICGKSFSRPWLLQGHIRTHTGEKPFSCNLCHRAFADRSNLRAHLQTHAEVKKYPCTFCGKTFSRNSLLTKHNEVGCMSIRTPY